MRRIEVPMGELVTHAGDVDPWDLRLVVVEVRADSFDGFTDLNQAKPDGIEYQAVIERSSVHVDRDCRKRIGDVCKPLLVMSTHSGTDSESAAAFTVGRMLSAGTTSTGE